MLSSLALALAVGLLLIAWVAATLQRRRGQAVSPTVVVFASAAAPLALTLVVAVAAPRFGDLRVALEGLRVAVGPGAAEEVRVGGSQAIDHLVVGDLPAGFLTFRAEGERVVAVVTAERAAAGDGDEDAPPAARALVRVGGSDGEFHNSFPLTAGDVLAVDGGPTLAFDPDRPGLGPAAQGFPPLPTRRGRLGLPVGRQLGPELEVAPLAAYGAPATPGTGAGAATPPGAGGEAPAAFVYRHGGYLRRGFRVAFAEPGVELRRPALAPLVFQPEVLTLEEGDSARLALFRVDVEPLPEQDGDPRSRVQERRSFRARHAGGVLDLVFDTPLFVRVRRADLAAMAERTAEEPLLALVGRRDALAAMDPRQMLLHFPVLGEPLASEAFARIRPEGRRLRVTTHTGTRLYENGEAFAVGERAAALVRVSRLGVPWGALLTAWALAAAATFAGWNWRRGALALVLLTGTELFLALRVLIAYQGAYLDPAAAGAAWTSMGALVWVPFVLQATLAFYQGGRPRGALLLHLAVSAAAAAAVLAAAGADTTGWLFGLTGPPVAALAAGFGLRAFDALFARLPEWRPGPAPPPLRWQAPLVALAALGGVGLAALLLAVGDGVGMALAALLVPLAAAGAAMGLAAAARALAHRAEGSLIGAWLGSPRGRWAAAVAALTLAAAAFRGVTLFGLGWKERIDLGGAALAVSVYYTPLVLVVFALIWAGRRWWESAPLSWLALGVLLFALPVAAHDLGTPLIFALPPVLLLAVAPFEGPGRHRWLLAAPLAATLLVHTIGAGIFQALPLQGSDWAAPGAEVTAAAARSPDEAQAFLARSVAARGNALRVWSWAAPESLRQVGTTSSESLTVVMETLRDYASRGAFGTGYLGVPLAPALAATHLDDNLSAVHLLGTFGWLGGLAVAVLLVAWAVLAPLLGLGDGAGRGAGWTPRRAFGLLCVWTLSAAGLYMLSANVGMMLFTGKNVYLLAADSLSDAVEGTLLVALALWAFHPRPAAEGEPA